MKSYTTSGGKEIQLAICPKTAHIKIQFSTGGELPAELSGLYTAEWFAEQDIIKYLGKTVETPVNKSKK